MGDCLILMKNYNSPRTETYTVTSKESAIDMGEYNNFRYINSSGVPNVNSSTYTPTSRSASLDIGEANGYFLGWYNGNTLLTRNLSYTFTLSGNVNYTARFCSVKQIGPKVAS